MLPLEHVILELFQMDGPLTAPAGPTEPIKESLGSSIWSLQQILIALKRLGGYTPDFHASMSLQ